MGNTTNVAESRPEIRRSNALFNRAERLIPSGTMTLAKGPGQHVEGVAPKYLDHGRGARVWDVDGNEYLDLTMGVGPLSLGYADEDVNRAITDQLQRGISFSLMHPLEVEVAELVHELIPNAEMVRFAKNGADVTSAAVRLARAFTGRDRVLCCGYHGWHDWYIGVTARNRGVPRAVQDLTFTFDYNDIGSVIDGLTDDVAAVILEPVTFEEPRDRFLHRLKRECQRCGALLIFDEMWTGFRLALGGAQEAFDVVPDLACYSKAVANGMPLSVLTGRRDVMTLLDEDVFFYSTFGGETLSLAAARTTIRKLKSADVPAAIARGGRRLREEVNRLADELEMGYVRCTGLDYRTMMSFAPSAADPLLLKSLVQQELIRRGVLWSGFHNLSLAHTDAELDFLLTAYRQVLPVLRDAVASDSVADRLEGRPIEPIFRKTGRFNTKPAARSDDD